ncbi:hypothetical protein ACFSKU_21365 [Pontibacter silvestris]|uniref:Lipoprotein n=1 Tax=Pontibacter silvestris TaxID=2305183 RepID=A0ABW4X5H5_9BACT|nr:hypothetical protein [Pontibacter silvestris]MCC9137896.1 hypothetical protein [Pontibacter silvestris]
MKKEWKSIIAALFLGTSMLMTSCGGNNGDMPPETTNGDNNRETGVDGNGYTMDPGSPDTTGTTTNMDTISTTTRSTTESATTTGGN